MQRFLKFAIATLLGLIFIGAMVWLNDKGNAVFGASKSKITGISSQSKTFEFKEYDNQNLLGTDVTYAADQFSTRTQFAVKIVTKASGTTGFYAANTSTSPQICYTAGTTPGTTAVSGPCGTIVPVSAMNDTTSANIPNFVNPTAVFNSQIYNDSNNITRLIVFTQQ